MARLLRELCKLFLTTEAVTWPLGLGHLLWTLSPVTRPVWLRADFSNIIRSKVDWGAAWGVTEAVWEAGPTEASPLSWISRPRLVWSRSPTEAPVWRDEAPVTGVTTIPRQWDAGITRGDTCLAEQSWDPRVSWPHVSGSVSDQILCGLKSVIMGWWLLKTFIEWELN